MNVFAEILLVGWIPLVLGLFSLTRPKTAVLIALLGGWLFLPNAGYRLPALPEYTKVTATSLALVLGTTIFDAGRLTRLRLHWLDLPVLAWCFSPFASSLSNQLGAYDGVSAVVSHVITWGLPYLVGRMHFSDLASLRQFCFAIVIAGLIYVPLCLFENRMHPQLHKMFYGFGGGGARMYEGFAMFGWQPKVFMQNALALTMFMGSASLVAVSLWLSRGARTDRVRWQLVAPALLLTTVLCKSLGALMLTGAGIATLLMARSFRSRAAIVCVALFVPAYCIARANQWVPREALTGYAAQVFSIDRTESLGVRLENEDRLSARAMERPYFGWGRWGRNRVVNDEGKDITLADGLWVIALGQQGVVGLAALMGMLLLAPLVVIMRLRPERWSDPQFAPAIVCAIMLVLYTVDCLMNAMLNPIFVTAAGGLAGLGASWPCGRPATSPPRASSTDHRNRNRYAYADERPGLA